MKDEASQGFYTVEEDDPMIFIDGHSINHEYLRYLEESSVGENDKIEKHFYICLCVGICGNSCVTPTLHTIHRKTPSVKNPPVCCLVAMGLTGCC